MVTDTIADMFTQIRNAQAVGKDSVWINYSRLRLEIARLLGRNDFIRGVESRGKKVNKKIGLRLKYKKEKPVIHELQRISKPGRRVYRSADEIKRYKGGRGVIIISTPAGIMNGRKARQKNIGGEVIGKVW